MKHKLHKLLISGECADFTTFELDLDKKELNFLGSYAAPSNYSWVERSSQHENIDYLVGLSEGVDSGLLYSFEIDHAQNTCTITSQKPTLGAPGYFLTLHDGSALAPGTLGDSILTYPIDVTKTSGSLLSDIPRTEIFPKFPYELVGHGPNEGRQRQCHIHQILEDSRGLLYSPDLGSDRVWIIRREAMTLELYGWLQCPAGTGARHAVITPNEMIIYVLGELSHTVIAFDLSAAPAEDMQPIGGFAPNVIPPTVHPDHQFMMDSAEICLHTTIPNILYVSNRWERQIAEREPHLKKVPKLLPPGDDVAVILLSQDGRNVDVIRGMRLSDDGRYVVVVWQEDGGVEVYEISGERGDSWTLVADLYDPL